MFKGLISFSLILTLAAAPVPAWLGVAIGAIPNSLDLVQVQSNGKISQQILNFPIDPSEIEEDGAFACGRGFCLLVTNLLSQGKSVLRNISFFNPPQVLSTVVFDHLSYNLHSNLGEGDGGSAHLIIHDTTANTWIIGEIDTNVVVPVVDITSEVNLQGGQIYSGGSAYCAPTSTMWVAIDRPGGDTDTLLTVDLATKKVTATLALNMPVLASHFADCNANRPGGYLVHSSGKSRHSVVSGLIDLIDGGFDPVDAIDLPPGSKLDISSIGAALSPFSASYGAVLYTDTNTLPGSLYVSTPANGRGSAVLNDLDTVIFGLALEY
jgi:hypothetical protein